MKHIKGCAVEVFKAAEGNAVLIHQVNCQGVMGSGIAKQIREEYPQHFLDYQELCEHYKGFPSVTVLGEFVNTLLSHEKMIVGLFGQDNYGIGERQTNYAALAAALMETFTHIAAKGHQYIVPKLIGCGLGGGEWHIVEQILVDIEKWMDVEFTVVEYDK